MRKIVIYPGRFQPPHIGHLKTYNLLCKHFGKDNVYICTTNKIKYPESIFDFETRKYLLTRILKISQSNIIQVSSPYTPEQFFKGSGITPDEVILFAALGNKDKDRIKMNVTLKNGNLGYYISPPKGKEVYYNANKHGYILFYKDIMSAVNLRKALLDMNIGNDVKVKLWNEMTGLDEKELNFVMQKVNETLK
jgi:cytidyltransferase-like protein